MRSFVNNRTVIFSILATFFQKIAATTSRKYQKNSSDINFEDY